MDVRPLSAVQVPGWRIAHVAATASTNATAKERPEAGLVVVADHQTAGRGRLDRVWETPAGVALTSSAVVDPHQPDAHWPWLPLLVGVAVTDAVRASTGLPADLKWPNDVLVEGRKLAGILVERVQGPAGPLAVIGVGLNVHQTGLPVPTATSLALEGAAVDRAVLLEALLEAYADELAAWARPGGAARLRAAYLERCVTVGLDVRVELPTGSLVGRADGIDEQGRLQVSDASDGVRRAVGAGDVVHVRPATDPPGRSPNQGTNP